MFWHQFEKDIKNPNPAFYFMTVYKKAEKFPTSSKR